MTLSDELLPCPFCGAELLPDEYSELGVVTVYRHPYNACFLNGQMRGIRFPADTEAWNRRASPHGDAGGRQSITEALRMMNCPRPCNHRPDEFTVGECVDAGECGCVAGNGLYASPGSSAGAEPLGDAGKAALEDDLLAMLRDPNAVHQNMLRGTIAKPSVEQIAHLYGDALYSAPPQREGLEEATHRHKKRGTEYVLIGYGKMQAESWAEIAQDEFGTTASKIANVDMREVAIYRSVNDGSLWVRPREEFEDGRFDTLTGKGGE